MWILLGLFSAITAAAVAILGKLALSSLDATLATTIRSVIMAGFLLLVSIFSGKFSLLINSSLSGKQWGYIIASGIAGALSWLAFFAALQTGHASKVAALDRTSIVFVVFLSALFLGDGLGWKSIVGALLIVCGVLLITIK